MILTAINKGVKMKNLDKDIAKEKKLKKLIDNYLNAKDKAEAYFLSLKQDKELWARICQLSNADKNSDFGDWTC